METLKEFSFDKLKDITEGKVYNLVYLNYDKANGIKLLSDVIELTEDEKKGFYRIYIFNNDYMVTIFNFGNGIFRYNKIEKDDFESYNEKYLYLKSNEVKFQNKRLKVRVGNLKIDNSREVVQYVEIIGGDKE